jgi:hypothetical protein
VPGVALATGLLLALRINKIMATPLTGQQIIDRFELYTDDTTDLSSDEELILANDKIRLIYMEQPWEFLRRKKTGVIESDGKITLSSDFDEFLENFSDDPTIGEAVMKVVYIGSQKSPYLVVPMGQRNANNFSNVCWIDPSDGKINFSQNPGRGATYEYDYKTSPDDVTVATSPKLPPEYHPMIIFSMLIDEEIIKKSEKARSNMQDNAVQYQRYMKNLKLRDARFKLA